MAILLQTISEDYIEDFLLFCFGEAGVPVKLVCVGSLGVGSYAQGGAILLPAPGFDVLYELFSYSFATIVFIDHQSTDLAIGQALEPNGMENVDPPNHMVTIECSPGCVAAAVVNVPDLRGGNSICHIIAELAGKGSDLWRIGFGYFTDGYVHAVKIRMYSGLGCLTV